MARKVKADKARFTMPIASWVPSETVVAKVKQQVANVQKCDDFANQPDIQSRVKLVSLSADDISTTLVDLAAAKQLVAKLEGQRDQQLVVLQANHDALESSVNVACKGQIAMIKAYGGTPAGRNTPAPSTDPPMKTEIAVAPTPGCIAAKCKADRDAHGYLFQIGTDPNTPDAWPNPAFSGGARHVFTDLPVGQKVYVRIAIQRRHGGLSQWSGLLEITVR
jgi:hypothetical protein